MKIQDLIVKTKKVKWQDLVDLQPENLKTDYHSGKTKKSIIDLGFAQAIYVWQDPSDGKIKIIDGHLRTDLLRELVAEGFDVPDELSCTFLDNKKIKTSEDAIKYLLRVFNVKTNPIDTSELDGWLESMDLTFEDIKVDVSDLDISNTTFQSETSFNDVNTEINFNDINGNECKIVLKYDAITYESIIEKIGKIKTDNKIPTNESLFLYLLSEYGA
jgi:hypothetical protein